MPDLTVPRPEASPGGFTPEQKQYLEGFFAAVARHVPFVGMTTAGQLTSEPAQAAGANLAGPPPEDTVHGTPLSELAKPERWKYEENPLEIWEKLVAHAEADRFPDEADTFRFKFHGLFYVAPAQDSFMFRLRIPAGELTAHQLRGVAELAEWGGGYSHITTRANLQVRELRPREIVRVLVRLQELGLTSRGAGADNVRNITASPNSGFDPDELLDVRPFAKALHHYILNHRDLYDLPRKFNISFDNGGSLAGAADTNDIGFMAVRVTERSLAKAMGGDAADVARSGGPGGPGSATLATPAALPGPGGDATPSSPQGAPDRDGAAAAPAPAARPGSIAPGIYFRVQLGGISGHGDFARDTGLLVQASECVAVAAAMVRVFSEHGDRTNRKKARLKYLLDRWGVDCFLEETQRKLAFPLLRLPLAACEPRRPELKHGWVGVSRQAQHGLNSIGVAIPVGRLTAKQMRQLADVATHYGTGELRLTVWQSVIIPHVPDAFVETARRGLERLGFATDEHSLTTGIIACTGSKGCRYSSTDTKGHAVALAKALARARLSIEQPVNLHFTGCPNSCAQHYCGDLGFVGAKLADGREGYHVVLGGGMGCEQGLAREIFRGVAAEEVPALTEKILRTYDRDKQAGESFVQWSRRHSVGKLQELLSD